KEPVLPPRKPQISSAAPSVDPWAGAVPRRVDLSKPFQAVPDISPTATEPPVAPKPELAPVASEPAARVPAAQAPSVIKPDPRVAQAEKRLATAQGKAEAGAGTKGSEASTLVHEGEERGAKITADVAEQQGAKTVATESKQPLTANPPSETKPQGNLPSAPTAGQPTSGEPPGFEVRGVRIEDEPRSIMIRQG